MHDGVGPVLGHDRVDCRPVRQIALDKRGRRMDRGAMALIQIVEDNNLCAVPDQLLDVILPI